MLRLHSSRTIRPTELVNAVFLQNPSLEPGLQHDVAEVLESLLSADSRAPCPDQNLGVLSDTISCLKCGLKNVKTKSLVTPIIQVPITASSLEGCFNNLFVPQPLEGRKCGVCQSVTSTISTQLCGMPHSIIIHLLRFRHGTLTEKNTSDVKLTSSVILDGTTWYITGIINHSGSLQRGHYTTYIHQQQSWYLCDDSRVAEVSGWSALNDSARSAYVIFLSKS